MADIVLVEDEDVPRRYLSEMVKRLGHTVRAAEDAEQGLSFVEEGEPDLVITDQRLPGMSGHDLLVKIKQSHPLVAVVVLTAHSNVDDAVEAMRCGAADYLCKPVNSEELRILIERCVAGLGLRNEVEYYRQRDLPESPLDGIVGDSPQIRALKEMVLKLSRSEKREGGGPTVLLSGETGSGKGLVARALHQSAPRRNAPFVEVNCAALPEQLLEAELLGYERGAFTGAVSAKAGLFEAAENGTVFLDEIGRINLDLQAKVLKVIEDKIFRRLGSTRERVMHCSIISATHLDLDKAVREGRFLADLYHRIRVFRIHCPPLRERGEDVLALAEHYLAKHAAEYGLSAPILSAKVRKRLLEYSWPGNVRELSHAMERVVVLGSYEDLDLDDSFAGFDDGSAGADPQPPDEAGREGVIPGFSIDFSHGPISLEQLNAAIIRQAYDAAQGNRKKTAALLGISLDTLRYRLDKFGIA